MWISLFRLKNLINFICIFVEKKRGQLYLAIGSHPLLYINQHLADFFYKSTGFQVKMLVFVAKHPKIWEKILKSLEKYLKIREEEISWMLQNSIIWIMHQM